MGGVGKGDYKDGSKGAGMGGDVQVGGTDRATVHKREFCCDGFYAEGSGGVPPSSGSVYIRDVRTASWVWGVGVVIGG